jgi:hypothetical protein
VDLRLYFRVLWRFRILVGVGFVLAIALALLATVRVDLSHGAPKLVYRSHETWMTSSTMLVTKAGFPIGRSTDADPNDSAHLAELATIYATLASSDAVRQLMLQDGPIHGTVTAAPVTSPVDAGFVLPMVRVSGTATTPRAALTVTRRASGALKTYIEQQQESNGIASHQRVILRQVSGPLTSLTRVEGRPKTLPAVVFLAVLTAVLGLAFVLENMRPRTLVVAPEPRQSSTLPGAASSRSA